MCGFAPLPQNKKLDFYVSIF